MDKNLEERINAIGEDIHKMDEIRRKIRKPMCEAIHDMCVENGGEIDLRVYNEVYCGMSISYDGGNHPEYDSEAFAEIIKVKPIMLKDWVNDGKEYKSFEVTLRGYADDYDEYDEGRMSCDEVESVYRQVLGYFYADKEELEEYAKEYLYDEEESED